MSDNQLQEALQGLINNQLRTLELRSNRMCCFIPFSLHTGSNIGDEGAIKISEALKSNTSLTSLHLYGNSNRLSLF
jgi:hypothetical protein